VLDPGLAATSVRWLPWWGKRLPLGAEGKADFAICDTPFNTVVTSVGWRSNTPPCGAASGVSCKPLNNKTANGLQSRGRRFDSDLSLHKLKMKQRVKAPSGAFSLCGLCCVIFG